MHPSQDLNSRAKIIGHGISCYYLLEITGSNLQYVSQSGFLVMSHAVLLGANVDEPRRTNGKIPILTWCLNGYPFDPFYFLVFPSK